MESTSIVIVGATGMVGGIALRICLDDPAVSKVTVVGRRPTGFQHAKLREVSHDDFVDFAAIAQALADHHVALYCLGAYTGTVPDDEFRRVTVDFTLGFARALYAASPEAAFCFLSGQGADQTERSRMAFARYKGAAEKELLQVGFSRVHIFRPGYIYPVTPREEPNLGYRLMRVVYPIIRHVYPDIGVASDDLARAMVRAGLHGTRGHDQPVLENRDIRALAG
jgi:uncharacterized protein YbjT (DUF2867 family)